jgi:predicted enzyme related to lactoylglutathione lyase
MLRAVVSQFEIAAKDPDVVRRFYALLFGWRMSAEAPGPRNANATGASGSQTEVAIISANGDSTGLRLIVEVDDVFENLSYAEELGGTVIDPPHECTSDGRRVTMASFADPEGNRVGLSNRLQKLAAAPETPA